MNSILDHELDSSLDLAPLQALASQLKREKQLKRDIKQDLLRQL